MRLALAPKVAVVEGDTAVAEADKVVAEVDKAEIEADKAMAEVDTVVDEGAADEVPQDELVLTPRKKLVVGYLPDYFTTIPNRR